MNKYFKFNFGFTLLEAIFAISILIFTLSGSFVLISRISAFSPQLQSKLIASYLTQEGIEIVRNIRDNNWLDPTNPDWNEGLGNGEYEVDCNDSDLTSCPSPCDYDHNLRFLKIDSNGFYSYDSGVDSNFKRKITISDSGTEKMTVTVEVFWKEKGKLQSVKAVENLYNWR
jgi:hypothetical protein